MRLVPPCPIWDLHCHLLGIDGRTPEEKMAKLLAHADRFGIEKVCLFFSSTWAQTPTADQLRADNDYTLQAAAHWSDRALPFCYVSAEHVETSLQEMNRCIADGPMVGIKLWVARRANSEGMDTIIRRAAELNAVIFQHTWFKANVPLIAGESTPMDLAELARRHPQVHFICGHAGGQWEMGIRAIRDCPNVSIELAGSDPTAGFTEMAVRELGAERIIYGSDAAGRSIASQLAKVYGANLNDQQRCLILRDNLKRQVDAALRRRGS